MQKILKYISLVSFERRILIIKILTGISDYKLQITNWTSKNRFANLYNTIFSICYTWKHYQTLFLGQPLNDASWIMQYAMYHALCIMYHALCIMHHKNRSCITHHIISLCTFWIFPILHIYFLFPLLPSSAQAPAQLAIELTLVVHFVHSLPPPLYQ